MNYYVVDAFAEKVFEGNPAGVCIMEEWLSESTMQDIAVENNLSETAFAVKQGEVYYLRWFTPGGEIDLCGHATLATAFVITEFYEKDQTVLRFETMSGELTVRKQDGLFELDFPAIIPESYPMDESIASILGAEPVEVYKGRDLIVRLTSEEAVRNLTPDFEKLKALPGLGVFVTAESEEYDYVARAFFPKLNINEDPVTGAMQCSLVPFWTERLGKAEFVVRQLSQRGGTLYCENHTDRIKIKGSAVLYLTGNIQIN